MSRIIGSPLRYIQGPNEIENIFNDIEFNLKSLLHLKKEMQKLKIKKTNTKLSLKTLMVNLQWLKLTV